MVFKNFLSKAKDIDILASLPDGVILVDNLGKIEWANELAPTLLKMQKTEVFKANFNGIVESGLELTKQAVESGRQVVGRLINAERDTYLEITAKTVEDYTIVAFRDVTQSYKTVTNIITEHESSRKINKDKNMFLLKLANEFKSPIHSIVGFSQAMIDGLGGEMSDKQDKYIKIINKNSSELLYFMDKVFELSKTESGLFEQDFQLFDVVHTAQYVIKNFETIIKDKKLNLTFEMEEPAKKTIFSDENLVKSILTNILETSLDLTDIGSINIKIQHPDMGTLSNHGIIIPEELTESAYLMFNISDTGAGISDTDLRVIFEPYAQLDRANKKNIARSIAMASAKNLVKALKGSIWIDSEPMQGTSFSFAIPIEKIQYI